MPTVRNQPITSWQDGDSVSGFALLAKKESRQDRNAKTFLDLELQDASGSISGKVWSDSPALEGTFEAHDFVAVKGVVKNYRNQLQISVQECRVATDGDREYGFDETLLIPTTKEDIDDLWSRLGTLLSGVENPHLRELAQKTLEVHGAELREHPAAKSIHHAFRGGLLEHTVSMSELAARIAEHYPELDRDLILLGVLFHDIGKLAELGAMPANDYTMAGRLVGHVVLGRDLLRSRCAEIDGFPRDLQLRLEHMVLSHQGRLEYGSPVEPKTSEALVLHFIDDLDSKLSQFRQAGDRATGMQFLRGLGRFVLLEPEKEGPGPAGAPHEGLETGPKSGPEQAKLKL